ncbi:hypothetical protein B0H21DRAFT_104577 [Amylocystis lapponica]|nr:hypothetical protein B0H21DRAFT_104577 [Amylocystis lapponica]
MLQRRCLLAYIRSWSCPATTATRRHSHTRAVRLRKWRWSSILMSSGRSRTLTLSKRQVLLNSSTAATDDDKREAAQSPVFDRCPDSGGRHCAVKIRKIQTTLASSGGTSTVGPATIRVQCPLKAHGTDGIASTSYTCIVSNRSFYVHVRVLQ